MATVKKTSKEVEEFMEKLYSSAKEELKKCLAAFNKTDKEIQELMECANFIYKIDKSSREFKDLERFLVTAVMSILQKDEEEIEDIISDFFDMSLEEMLDFYNCELEELEKDKIKDKRTYGFNYKQRIKRNQKIINNRIIKDMKKSLRDNDIKNTKKWTRTGRKISLNKAKGILETEVNRILNDAFIMLNIDKKLVYNSVLEKRTCSDCASLHGSIFDAKDAFGIIPQHNHCKCYWERL